MVHGYVPRTAMPRPRIDLEEGDIDRVEQYAADNGLRMPRAYAELIRKGLSADDCEAAEA